MNEWWKDPKILALGAVGLVVVYILMKPKSQATGQQNIGDFQTTGLTTPVGQSYSYLDGNGMQHMIATDPNGQLTSYNTIPPGTGYPQTGQLANYVGMMSNIGYVTPYGFATPYYSQSPYYTSSYYSQSPYYTSSN